VSQNEEKTMMNHQQVRSVTNITSSKIDESNIKGDKMVKGGS